MAKVKHVVLLKLKPDLPQSRIDELFAAIAALQDKIPGILEFSGGPYSSPEGFNREYTHGFMMTFADAASRDVYLPHPDHNVVSALALPMVVGGQDGAVAFDWEEGDYS